MPLKRKSKKATENVVEKSVEVPEPETEVKELPSVEESPELKKIAEASQKVEKIEKKKKKKSSETETEAEKKKSFLSITDSTNDGKTPKVRS